MSQLIQIKYVGKKPFAFDNIANSGKGWNGPGDVQEVTAPQAKLLLKYADQWALANPGDAALFSAPVTVKVVDEAGEKVVIDTDALTKPLEKMTKPELVAYAFNRWGKELDASEGKKLLLDQVEEFERDLPPKVGVPVAQ